MSVTHEMIELKPYEYDIADEVFDALFNHGLPRDDGLEEIPAASLQLVVSALEYIAWDLYGDDRNTIKTAIGIVQQLRDTQKKREWKRKHSFPYPGETFADHTTKLFLTEE